MFRFFPRNNQFFDLFEEAAANIIEGAKLLLAMVNDFSNLEDYARRIKAVEHKGDELTHQTIIKLNQTFITPLDREDIHALTERLDDVLDYVEAASERLVLFNVEKPKGPELTDLVLTLVAATEEIARMVPRLRDLRHAKEILQGCVEVNRLENEGDRLLRQGLATLFRTEPNPLEIIKWKEIYETLEVGTDKCEDVANILEGVVLKYA